MNAIVGKSHPIFIIAAIAVILFSVVGIGAVTGLIPSTFSKNAATPEAGALPVTALTAPVTAQESAPTPPPVIAEPEQKAAPVNANNELGKAAPAPKPSHVARKPRPAPRNQEIAAPEPSYSSPGPLAAIEPPAAPVVCRDCGVIEAITPVEKQGKGSGLGAVAGGVLGGVLGHQVGNGRGKDLATVAGVIGGALGGNQIEKSQKKTVEYDVVVRLDDKTAQIVHFQSEPGFYVGEPVKVVGGQVQRR